MAAKTYIIFPFSVPAFDYGGNENKHLRAVIITCRRKCREPIFFPRAHLPPHARRLSEDSVKYLMEKCSKVLLCYDKEAMTPLMMEEVMWAKQLDREIIHFPD